MLRKAKHLQRKWPQKKQRKKQRQDKERKRKREKSRQENPEKQWKITDEDWRNREKWEEYEKAVDEMIVRTSTKEAPWHIIEANSKLHARIRVMEIVVDALEKALKEIK